MKLSIEQTETRWHLFGGGLSLDIDRHTGCLARLELNHATTAVWTEQPGNVVVRDDLLRREFDRRDLERVDFSRQGHRLELTKHFRGAPWVLRETYTVDAETIHWAATVTLDAGAYRSCEVRYHIPWHLPLYPMSWWAAKDGMPSAPHKFGQVALEYGEISAGITIPALCCYQKNPDLGLLLAMPFDFKTPRLRFISGYRDPDLQVSFDWLALAPGRPARAMFYFHAGAPDWRPALGWLYQRHQEYFEPRSALIHRLWGGHISGGFNVSAAEAKTMAALGLKWHEVHAHFLAYGNYHPEGVEQWRSGHERQNETMITVAMVRQTIKNLHAAGAAALPYMQLSGDGDEKLLDKRFDGDRIRDWHNNLWPAWPGTYLMNSDPALAFGKDITRQIDGIVKRYPEMDGIFVDQPCYSFLDTAHDDGITAVENRPCYLTAWNFLPHLEHLARALGPERVIIGNAPFAVWQMKYIDACMAEASSWLCDQLQYYTIGQKPMYFLEYDTADSRIESMFQRCLIYAAGFTSYPGARASQDLFDQYIPLLKRLDRRRWVFDAEPLRLPAAFQGNVFRSPGGSLLVSLVKTMATLPGRAVRDTTVAVRTADSALVKRVTLQPPGGAIAPVAFRQENGGVQFDVPATTVAAVAELEF